ncbi:hypothetical protein ACR4XJ_01910 [Nitratidesulfovibrio sp. D1]|uniref:hypothetical protein n=1 Tax=Nitratidesulfovibrio sp. D1 TaxID=3440151 RepID=UPI003EBBF71B
MTDAQTMGHLWDGLGRPLLRLVLSMSAGLFVANCIEALHWTRGVARLAAPLVRLGHLRDVAGASFSLAFFSSVASNSLLAESYEKGELSRRELRFANLFNSLPSYFVHLPTLFFITWPVLGFPAVVYVGLTLLAAFLRTALTVACGRVLLPPLPEGCVACHLDGHESGGWRAGLRTAWLRFRKRMPRVVFFTVPTYAAVYFMQQAGWFHLAEAWMARHMDALSFLRPEALGIVLLHLAAEFGAAVSAAGAVLGGGALTEREIVLALLAGNVLSTPMRAFRHQFPSYSGYFKPALAVELIVVNQALRAASIALVGLGYYWATLP